MAKLLASMNEEPDGDASTVWDEEIKRRVHEIRPGRVKGIPVDEVSAKLRKKYH